MTSPLTPGNGSVVITTEAMYHILLETKASVDHLAASVSPALTDIRKDIDELKDDRDAMRTRQDDIEKAQIESDTRHTTRYRTLAGACAAVATILTILAAFLAVYQH